MALIPGYEYDIFISYAHVDNTTLPGQAKGWVEQFYKNLDIMLAKRFGRSGMVKIWWDSKKLDGSTVFDDSIANGIERSAVMICINSPGYGASDYCKQELDQFYKRAQKDGFGLKVGDRSRIVNVLLNNIPFDKWPTELGGTTGFPFHDAKDRDDYGDPVEPLSSEFRSQMNDLKDAIAHLLADFAEKVTPAVPQQPKEEKTDPDAFTIYLGEVADTLRAPRKRVIAELEKKGFRVITGAPPPDEAKAHEEATLKAVGAAQLAVHLLDEFPGREIAGAPNMWYPKRQTELALQGKGAQMIWVPAELDIASLEEDEYRKFLLSVESGKVADKGFEFVRGTKSTVAQEIMDYAEQLKAQLAVKPPDGKQLSVLVDTHFNDQIHALDLSRALLENRIQPFINPQEDDPRKNMNVLGDRMGQTQKMIFLYGSVSKDWLKERINVALQLIINNRYPIEDLYVYMAPPYKEASEVPIEQRFLKVTVVNSSGVQDGSILRKFVSDLNARKA
jgi:hypothetical protein